MTDQSQNELKAAVDRAWADLNDLASELPDCGHVRRWKLEIEQAKKAHQKVLVAYKKATRQQRQDAPEDGTYSK
jgi:hypothetical protein